MKLTTAQWNLLREVYHGQRKTVDPAYKPAVKLAALKLAALTETRFGNTLITLTDLGRAEARRIWGDIPKTVR